MSNKFVNVPNGANFGSLDYTPGSAKEGDVYFDSVQKSLRFYANGRWYTAGQNLGSYSTAPSSPVNGDSYYDTALKTTRFYTGGIWYSLVRSEYDNGTVSGGTVTLSLDNGQSQKVVIDPAGATKVTIKITGGVIGNNYRLRVMFSEISNYIVPVVFSPSIQFSSLVGSQIVAEPYTQLFLNCSPTVAGVQASLETYEGLVFTHPVDTLPTNAESSTYSAAYISGGQVYVWGDLGYGQAGDNTTGPASFGYSRPLPTVPGPARSFSQVSLFPTGVLGLEASTGLAYSWGLLSNSTSGFNSTTSNPYTPVSVWGGRSYNLICAATSTAVAIEGSTGLAWAWGTGTGGALGNGGALSNASPVAVQGGKSWRVVSAGVGYAMAAVEASTGYAWAWGDGSSGQLGTGSTVSYSSPVSVQGARSFSQICASGAAVLALEGSTGYIWGWGNNASGQLGNNTVTSASSPVSVGLAKSFSKISLAGGNSVAVAIEGSTGQLYAWGNNTIVPLAVGVPSSIGGVSVPTAVLGGRSYSDVKAFMVGVMAIEASTNNIYIWGQVPGIKKYPTLPTVPVPVDPANHGNRLWSKLYPGESMALALEASTGFAYSWGSDGGSGVGLLGQGSAVTAAASPVTVLGTRSYSQLSQCTFSASGHSFGIEASTGLAWGWGLNSSGQLGIGIAGNASSPVLVSGKRSFKQIAAGFSSTASIEASTGLAYCWGLNSSGQLGVGNSVASASSPASVWGGRSFSQIVVGTSSTSAVTVALEASTGLAWAWGNNGVGQLGSGTIANSSSPVSVLGARSFKQIATDVNTGIVALEGSTGLAWAWGKNSIGQLGVNSTVNYSSPVSVFGGRSWSQLTAMGGRYFAVDGSTGTLYGWGGGYNVGDGQSTANNSSPVSVASGKNWRLVQASFTNQIAFIQDTMGTAYYWGSFVTDQLGLGAGNQSSPVALGRYLPRF